MSRTTSWRQVNAKSSRARHLMAAIGLGAGISMLGGSSISFYDESLPTTMNPLFSRGMVDRRTHELVFDRLFYRTSITNELKSNLVARWEKIEDGKALKVFLKEGVKWHDGTSLGPRDICFTVDAILDPKTPSPIAKPYRESIVGCESFEEENSAVITFVKPFHNPCERAAFSVLPAHAFDSTGISPDLDFSSRPVGTGPMRGEKGRQAVTFTAVPNAHHNPRITQAQVQEGGDPFVQVRTLLTGGVHGVIAVAPQHRPDVRASDDVALKSYDLRSWWFIALNTNKGVLSSQKVRAAIENTINRTQLRELTIGVTGDEANSPCEFVSGPFVASSPYYNRSVKVRPQANLAKAAELMREAGAHEEGGRWSLGGHPVALRIGMNAPLDSEAKDLLNQVGNQLQQGGFDRQVFRVPQDDWVTRAVTGHLGDEFDALIGKWSFGVVEEVNPIFHTRAGGLGALNIFDYSNAEVDSILDRYDAAKTDTEAQDAYYQLHEYLARDLPYIFLWKLDTKSAWRNEVRNNTISPYFYFTDFDGWRL